MLGYLFEVQVARLISKLLKHLRLTSNRWILRWQVCLGPNSKHFTIRECGLRLSLRTTQHLGWFREAQWFSLHFGGHRQLVNYYSWQSLTNLLIWIPQTAALQETALKTLFRFSFLARRPWSALQSSIQAFFSQFLACTLAVEWHKLLLTQ